MPYQPDWIPLIEMIAHFQVKDHCDEQQAAIEARNALYDGKVQSRFRGSDEWDRIESNKWASATIFKDGLVSFNWPSAGVPAPGWEPRRFLVEVLRADVLQIRSERATATYTTGAPGRPSSWHLVEPEAKRRMKEKKVPETLGEFACSLAEWLSNAHPEAARLKPKTIENKLREAWRNRPQN
jgi:hypothetical protein